MKVYTPDIVVPQKVENSIFLAGPTPRSRKIKAWRSDAIEILVDIGFTGSVIIPEMFGAEAWDPVYKEQVEWEWNAINAASVISFWVPRDIKGEMPAFTTNVEFGMFLDDQRMIYGRPDWAEKCRYLDFAYKKITGEDPQTELKGLLSQAMEYIKNEN